MNSKNEGDDGKNPSCATRGTAFMAGVECLLFGTDPGAETVSKVWLAHHLENGTTALPTTSSAKTNENLEATEPCSLPKIRFPCDPIMSRVVLVCRNPIEVLGGLCFSQKDFRKISLRGQFMILPHNKKNYTFNSSYCYISSCRLCAKES